MKIKHTFLFTLILGLAWAGYLFAYITGPDPASNGIFGDALACATAGCHVGNPLNVASGSMAISGLPASGWVPGQTYPLTITIQKSGAVLFGFQLSAVTDASNQQAGVLTPGNARVKVISAGGIQYAEHIDARVAPSGTFSVNWTAPSSAALGKVRFNLAGNAANGNIQNTGDFIYTRVDRVDPVSAPPPPPPFTNTFYFPQIANGIQSDGVSWKTTIFLTNPASSGTATGAVTFTTSSGSAFNISFVDNSGAVVGSGNTIPFTIGAGQSRKFVSTGSGALAVGYAIVGSDEVVKGTALFSEFNAAGGLIGEAGVPSAASTPAQAIFVDRQSGFDTGVAFANPNATPASITFQLLNSNGTALGSPVTQTLAGNQHTAAFVSQLFPATNFVGSMRITSNVPLAAVALRFAPSGLFTTLPPVVLP